jgi:hypothetical protein
MTKVAFNNLETVNSEQDITTAINSLHTRGASLQLDIHKTLVAIATRWSTSGDVRPVAKHINHLLTKDQLGGMRKNSIKAWVQTFMGLAVVEEGDNKGMMYAPKDIRDGKHIDVKAVTNNRWWEFKVEADYVPIDDPRKLIENLIKKLEKDRAKAGLSSVVEVEMINDLKGMVKATV